MISTSNRRVYGNMAGLEEDDSLDSDSDMLLDGELHKGFCF